MRRAASLPAVSFGMILEMAALKLPYMGQQAFPFAVLFGGMAAFWRLTRSHELVVTRAAGVSAWQFLLPVISIAFIIGVIKVALVNPLASATLSRYELLEAQRLKGRENYLAISKSGLWLRQSNAVGQAVVHSNYVLQQDDKVELGNVIVFLHDDSTQFKGRIDAKSASLEEGYWVLRDAWVTELDAPARFESEYLLETDLTLGKIQDSFAPPETMSFWELPEFISTLEKAGFSAVRHRLHWHALLAAPLLMCAMVLIAATFTLRQARRGGTTYVIAGGILTGFILYFFSDVVFALGLSGSIPVILAAWTPSGVATLLGLAMLLHLEDG